MNLNPAEFLTAEQCETIGSALTSRILEAIDTLAVGTTEESGLSLVLREGILALVENGEFFEEIDLKRIGMRLTDKLVEVL